MPNKNLTKEKNKIRNILYVILDLTIFIICIVEFYALINPKYRYLINISILGIYGVVFYIGYKNQLANKTSSLVTIIIVAIIVTYTLLNR